MSKLEVKSHNGHKFSIKRVRNTLVKKGYTYEARVYGTPHVAHGLTKSAAITRAKHEIDRRIKAYGARGFRENPMTDSTKAALLIGAVAAAGAGAVYLATSKPAEASAPSKPSKPDTPPSKPPSDQQQVSTVMYKGMTISISGSGSQWTANVPGVTSVVGVTKDDVIAQAKAAIDASIAPPVAWQPVQDLTFRWGAGSPGAYIFSVTNPQPGSPEMIALQGMQQSVAAQGASISPVTGVPQDWPADDRDPARSRGQIVVPTSGPPGAFQLPFAIAQSLNLKLWALPLGGTTAGLGDVLGRGPRGGGGGPHRGGGGPRHGGGGRPWHGRRWWWGGGYYPYDYYPYGYEIDYVAVPAECAAWSPPLRNMPQELVDYAMTALTQSRWQPVTQKMSDGWVYLFTREGGDIVIRRCMANA